MVEGEHMSPQIKGMTLRDWFAGMAIQGMLSNSSLLKSNGRFQRENFIAAYQVADEMILERRWSRNSELKKTKGDKKQ
jgi:hypothetical protein